MEFVLPLLAIGGVYISSHQARKEGFVDPSSRETIENASNETDAFNEKKEKEQYYRQLAEEEVYSPDPLPEYQNLSTAIPGQAPIRFPGGGAYAHPTTKRPRDMSMSHSQHASMELEKRMGYGSGQKPKKQEQLAIFTPQKNISFPDGAPSMSTILQDRAFISNNMGGVAPIRQVHQSSGILTSPDGNMLHVGANGSMERSREVGRQVDQMRTANNPKFGGSKYATYEGLEGPANASTKRGLTKDQIGTHQQNDKTNSSYERGTAWLAPAGGAYTGQKSRDNAQPANVRRVDSESYVAPATADIKGHAIYGIEEECSKNVYGAVPHPTISGVEGAAGVVSRRPTFQTETKRSAYENTNYVGSIGRIVGRALSTMLPTDTFREMYSGATQTYIAPSTSSSSQRIYSEEHAYNRPKRTMRELAENAPHFLQINAGPSGGGYSTQQTQSVDTNRHNTGPTNYTSAAGAPCQMYSRDHEYGREQKDTHNCTLHSSTPGGGMDLFNSNVNHVQKADDSRQINRAEGYSRGPSAIPSRDQAGRHSILEYNYRPTVENTRPNIDRSQYDNMYSKLTMNKIAEGFSKTQSI
jgi:hypothetical protein